MEGPSVADDLERLRRLYPERDYRLNRRGDGLTIWSGKNKKLNRGAVCRKHGREKRACKDSACGGGGSLCKKHKRQRHTCPDPECGGGTDICVKHLRRKGTCADPECGGGGLLCKKHGRQKQVCPDPECGGGVSLCDKHGRRKYYCPDRECGGGGGLCVKHVRPKNVCPDPECGGGNNLCVKHKRVKGECSDPECGGGEFLCVHLINRSLCPNLACGGGGSFCKHMIYRWTCLDPSCGGGTQRCAKHEKPLCECPDPECGGGTALCKHMIRRSMCPDLDCGGGNRLCLRGCGKHIAKDGYCKKCHPDYITAKVGASKVACKCIDDLERASGNAIQHAHYDLNQKAIVGIEHKPAGWPKKGVDGYYVDHQNDALIAFEFNGDYFHGHPSLWNKGSTHWGTPFKDLFNKTERSFQKLAALGYRVFYVWEYDYVALGAFQSVMSICREFNGVLEY